MRKLVIFMMLGLAFLLVACDPEVPQEPKELNVSVINEVIEERMIVVNVKVDGEVETLEELNEAIIQVVNAIYKKHQETIGPQSFTLIFNVFDKDITTDAPVYGSIGYKANANLQTPGLSLIKNNLKLK